MTKSLTIITNHSQVEHRDNQSETSPVYNFDESISLFLTNVNRVFGVNVMKEESKSHQAVSFCPLLRNNLMMYSPWLGIQTHVFSIS